MQLLDEDSPTHPTSVAETSACKPKTRYSNILPCKYDVHPCIQANDSFAIYTRERSRWGAIANPHAKGFDLPQHPQVPPRGMTLATE